MNRATDNLTHQKILIIGPCECGKSTVADVLAEARETPNDIYRPTIGVRILEVEAEVRSASTRVHVELWDVSGDTKYQKCWPAIKKDALGCVLVYNPEKPEQEQQAEQWYAQFPRALGMKPQQVMVVQAMRRPDAPRRMPLPAKLQAVGVGQPTVVTPDDLVGARKNFDQFLENVRSCITDKQRQEEEDVMKGG